MNKNKLQKHNHQVLSQSETTKVVSEKPESPVFKYIYYSVIVVASLIMLISGWGTGFHSDEMDQNAYGKAVMSYYSSGGKDTSYLHPVLSDSTKVAEAIKTYGALYEVFLNSATQLAGVEYEYDIRHLFIQLSGLLAMFIASIMTRRLTKSYLVASMTFLLIYFTPTFFGHSLMNSRDIPFAAGYTLAVYAMMLFMENFPKVTWKRTFFLAIALGLSMSVRIGGLILIPVMAILILLVLVLNGKTVREKVIKNLQQYVLHFSVIIGLPYLFAMISHPVIWSAPIENFMLCVNTAKKFPNRIPINFNGEFTSSLEIPQSYLITWMKLTFPIAVVGLLLVGMLFLITKISRSKDRVAFMLLVMAVFVPIVTAIVQHFALYNGWRHLLFIYPSMAVLATYWISGFVRDSKIGWLYLMVFVALFQHPIRWMIRNHPYEYLYFNEVSGGFAENYYLYETDGWQLSVKEASDWLMEQKEFREGKGFTLACNSSSPMYELFQNYYKDTGKKVTFAGYQSRNTVDWRYMIYNVNLLPSSYLKEIYPPAKTIKTIDVEGKPICAILYDPVRNDYKAARAVIVNDFANADSLLKLALKEDGYSERLLEASCISLARQDRLLEAESMYRKGLSLYPNNSYFHYFMGMHYALKKQSKEAITEIYNALERGYPESSVVYENLSKLYNDIGNIDKAKEMMQFADELRR